MTRTEPDILAFDFDGVICDGLIEYFQTAWQAYCRIWNPDQTQAPDGLAERFYRLRPVVETGWEMPLVLRSLLMGIPDDEILEDWQAIAKARIEAEHLQPSELGAAVDGVRDEWMARDMDDWLSQHRFYPGVVDRLRQILQSPCEVVMITTKESRFVRKLLQPQQVDLPESSIYGKDVKQPKHETLRQLQVAQPSAVDIWFIEDRLKTLQGIEAHPDLASVRLYLADWGYNTERDRAWAESSDRIHRLSLEQLAQSFPEWPDFH